MLVAEIGGECLDLRLVGYKIFLFLLGMETSSLLHHSTQHKMGARRDCTLDLVVSHRTCRDERCLARSISESIYFKDPELSLLAAHISATGGNLKLSRCYRQALQRAECSVKCLRSSSCYSSDGCARCRLRVLDL